MAIAELHRYESEFRPSDYEPRATTSNGGAGTQTPDAPVETRGTNPQVTLQQQVEGYRVQVFSATAIDTAKARKSAIEALFPNEWFYLEYDPPTYKIRAGNFLTRYEADKFARLLAQHGFSDAWPVPQRVFKNPPPPPANPK